MLLSLRILQDRSAEAAGRHFLMEHPRYGKVYTDTTDDCWTYEYKRMVDLLIYSDMFGYDMSYEHPEWFDLLNRTFLAQKEVFYAPESGRQMGYGQGYLTQSAIMLDRYEEMTECIETAAMFCYHHTDHSYIVPEGVIVHGSKRFWYRNSDLGNAVQQAEIVKCALAFAGNRRYCTGTGPPPCAASSGRLDLSGNGGIYRYKSGPYGGSVLVLLPARHRSRQNYRF